MHDPLLQWGLDCQTKGITVELTSVFVRPVNHTPAKAVDTCGLHDLSCHMARTNT